MNTKLIVSIIMVTLLTSHSVKAEEYQLPFSRADIPGTYEFFARPIFSCGTKAFITDIFNHPSYVDSFLPNNLRHLAEFLRNGNQTGKDAVYVRAVIRLFANKLKASSYINAYAFSDLLAELPELLTPHFVIKTDNMLGSLKDIIFEIQYHAFKEQFPEFKANPETFLSNLAQQIEEAAELRRVMAVFLEICLSRLIWSPDDQFNTWLMTKAIADQLTTLYEKTIVTDVEDLNSLCITLLERYCLFLDIAGAHIDVATFEKIQQDVNICRTPLLDLDEQEALLETKAQRFSRCLIELEAKARARASGLVC